MITLFISQKSTVQKCPASIKFPLTKLLIIITEHKVQTQDHVKNERDNLGFQESWVTRVGSKGAELKKSVLNFNSGFPLKQNHQNQN